MFFRHLTLNEMVVTGVTGDTKLKRSTAPISVVSGDELRHRASTNLVDALSRQPGVSQITTGGGISKPIIRGLGYNRIIVMDEGVRQEGQQWGDEHGVEIDANNVGSVEILKGPASLMYGSDAMAGVLILRPMPTMMVGKHHAALNTEYQTNNGLAGYSLNVKGNEHGFVWDGRYSDKWAHAYKNRYDGYVPGTQFRERAGRTMIGLNKGWGHTHLTWTAFHQKPSIAEGERDPLTGELECATSKVKTYSLALPFQQIRHHKLVWDNSIYLPKGHLQASLGYQQNRRQEFEDSPTDYELYFRLHTFTYDVRYLSPEWNGWRLATGVGGMWQRSLNLGEESLIPAYRLFDIGAYATTSRTWERWTLNGGLRFDHRHLNFHGRNFDAVTGSIGAVWNVTDHMNIRANVARGFRAPNMSELGSDGVHEGTLRYEQGDAHLRPEYSWQGDLGLDFTSHYLSAQVSLFANHISNYIFAQRLGGVLTQGMPTYAYTQGTARLLGFEVGFDLHPIHSIHFQNTFSYVDARQPNQPRDVRYLPMTPAPRWTSELKYEIIHNGKVLNNTYVAMEVEYNLPQHHYYRLDETETFTPGYALLNISAGTDIVVHKRKIAELYLTAANLLNKAYQNHLSRLKYCDMNAATDRRGIYNMGRNITLKLIVPIDF